MCEKKEVSVLIEEEILDECVSFGRAMELIWCNPQFDIQNELDYKAADIIIQLLSFKLNDLWLTWLYAEGSTAG